MNLSVGVRCIIHTTPASSTAGAVFPRRVSSFRELFLAVVGLVVHRT